VKNIIIVMHFNINAYYCFSLFLLAINQHSLNTVSGKQLLNLKQYWGCYQGGDMRVSILWDTNVTFRSVHHFQYSPPNSSPPFSSPAISTPATSSVILQSCKFQTPILAYLHAKFHLDPSNRLATVHQRHRQTGQTERTGQTHRQRSDSI